MSRRNPSRFSSSSRILYERESESEPESSDSEPECPEPAFEEIEKREEEEDEDEEEGEEDEGEEEQEVEKDIIASPERRNDENGKKKAPLITINLKKVCKVCKGKGHQAGFFGATYIDCPKKPCFLCKKPGHTTVSCPHRVAMDHGVIPAGKRNHKTSMDFVFERQLESKTQKLKPSFVIPNEVDCGIIRLHSRRITSLEFHPTRDTVILSGDKKGQVGIWDYGKLHEKTVYESIHSCIVNNIKFNMTSEWTFYTSSSDGTICCTDLETGLPNTLIDCNPNGWSGPSTWRMLYGMDIHSEKNLLLAADNFGYIYLIDGRSRNSVGNPILIHKKGSKVVGLHCNPLQPDILLSCGNDHFARIWDLRRLETESSLASLPHGRVVNSAYFSPHTGNKIITTSQDNRIRVWDSIFGDLESPSREIVHSHDFNRHLTPFKAEWDPKDFSESLAVIGRYISENYNDVALHPIDFIDTSTGKLVAEVIDQDITTITPVNKLHPRDDILASGSSRSLFIWKPKQEDADSKMEQKSREWLLGKLDKKSKKKFDDNSDDDDFDSKGKDAKGKKLESKSAKPMNKKVKI